MAVSISLIEIKAHLKALGYPVAYHHFEEEKDGIKPPEPPFIIYLVESNDNKSADNKSYIKIKNLDIELYTDLKDEAKEKEVENMLDALELPYEKGEIFIEAEDMFLVRYETQLIGG